MIIKLAVPVFTTDNTSPVFVPTGSPGTVIGVDVTAKTVRVRFDNVFRPAKDEGYPGPLTAEVDIAPDHVYLARRQDSY